MELDRTMVRFAARRYQRLTYRSREIRLGESTFLESRLLWHGTKGLIVLDALLGTSLPPSNCNQSSSQTAIKVPPQMSRPLPSASANFSNPGL